jgi:hypothetical protein
MSWGLPVRNGLSVGIGTLASLTSSAGIGGIRRPTMSLNFLLMSATSLDSRITFSRGTNATLTDSTGRITYAPNNMLLQSETGVGWDADSTTFTTGLPGVTGFTNGSFSFANGATNYPRAGVEATAGIQVTCSAWIWVTSGTVTVRPAAYYAGTWNLFGAGPIAVTSTPQRFTWTYTPTTNTSFGSGFAFQAIYSGGTGTVRVSGAQLERVTYQTTPSTYVATTSTAYYGPRFDYDPVTLAPRGLLVEEARTNLLTYSEQFDNAAWGVSGLTRAANSTTSPDGTSNADTITGNSGTNAVIFAASPVVASATSYTASCYIKQGSSAWVVLSLWTGSGTNGVNVWFNAQTGAVGSNSVTAGYAFTSASSAVSGNGWYRITITGTVPAADLYWSLRLVDSDNAFVYTNTVGDTLYIWGAQLETGGFVTSYIPTVASTVTRNADSASMTGTNFSSWYNQSEGTFVADAARGGANVAAYMLAASDNTAAEWMGINFATSQRAAASMVDGGAAQFSIATPADVAPINTVTKAAFTYKLNDSNLAVNGLAFTTDTSCTIPTTNRLYIGADVNGAGFFLNGHIRQIAYYNTRLPNSQLQTLTAPSLAPTLSLDFTAGSYNVGF